MKVFELPHHLPVEVVSEPDGDLPAPSSLLDGLVGMGNGQLFALKEFKGRADVDDYIARFSEYLETSGKGGERMVFWVEKPVFANVLSKLRELPGPSSPSSNLLADPSSMEQSPETSLPDEVYSEKDGIPIPESL